jgi:hypothetical protein
MRISTCLVGLALLSPLGTVTACGDDDASDDAVTEEEYRDAICARTAGLDPGFDAFFAEHPEPTLDDWAAFLPGVVATMNELYEALDETPAPAEFQAAVDDAVDAIGTVRDNFQASADAAAAGDADELARIEEQNQSVDVPAMEAAMDFGDGSECPTGEG